MNTEHVQVRFSNLDTKLWFWRFFGEDVIIENGALEIRLPLCIIESIYEEVRER